MTTENWINVAMIIAVIMTAAATLVGPVLAVIVQVRMSQPKPIPDVNQPTKPASRFTRLLTSSTLSKFLLIMALIGAPVLIGAFVILPLSRLSVSALVIGVTSPMIQLLSVVVDGLTKQISTLAIVVHANQMVLHDSMKILTEDQPHP